MAAKLKICYVITESGGKSFWNRIGVAFENSDGSLDVKLSALPVNGEMQIRDYVPPEDREYPAKKSGKKAERGGPGASPDEDDIPFRQYGLKRTEE